MLTLYHAPMSRSGTMLWILEEHPYLACDGPALPDFFLAAALSFVRSLLLESQAPDDYGQRMNERPIAVRLRGEG